MKLQIGIRMFLKDKNTRYAILIFFHLINNIKINKKLHVLAMSTIKHDKPKETTHSLFINLHIFYALANKMSIERILFN